MSHKERQDMAKGEIQINEKECLGCGYCVKFCTQECIVISGKEVTPDGYLLPTFANPDKCTACGVCSWMCPPFAIEVYKVLEE